MSTTAAIIVHGGAGQWREAHRGAARAGCEAAVRAGLAILRAGGEALEAVQAAVRVLEDDPVFNAGTGAVLNREGGCEMDAALMDGASLRFGAVAAVPNAPRAIELARAVFDDGEHVLLCGEGAWKLGRERGLEPGDPARIITAHARERLAEEAATRRADRSVDPGTVGAVAIDARGHVAAATSTGGTSYKRQGRIGDTPLCGCGTYADDRGGAASATGHGESVIRSTTTVHCVNLMAEGRPAAEAAWAVIDALAARVGGTGGVICVDRAGKLGAAHNTPAMAWGAGAVDRAEVVADITIARGARILGL